MTSRASNGNGCLICGKPTPFNGKRLFCSKECERNMRESGRRRCRWCDTPLYAREGEKTYYFLDRAYCDADCVAASRKDKPLPVRPVREVLQKVSWDDVKFEDDPAAEADKGSEARLYRPSGIGRSFTSSTSQWVVDS